MRLRLNSAALLAILSVIYALTVGGPLPDLGYSQALEATELSADADVSEPADEAGGLNASPGVTQVAMNGELATGQDAPTDKDPIDEVIGGIGGPDETEVLQSVAAPVPEEPQGIESLITEHIVQQGESLWEIAKSYGIDVNTIVSVNELANASRLSVGEKLKILTIKGVLHAVKGGESLWDIAKEYDVDVDEIVAINHLDNPQVIQPKQELVIPGAEVASRVAAKITRSVVSASGKLQRVFEWPVRGRISSRFGQRWGRPHEGLDIAVITGTKVRAAAAGRVTWSGNNGGYGLLVKIDHGNGVETRYGHNSKLLVKSGQYVKAGQVIAYSGSTGNSTGPHVHFEIRLRGVAKNPELYLQ